MPIFSYLSPKTTPKPVIVESREAKTPGVAQGAPILLYDRVTVLPNGEQPLKSKSFTNNRSRRIQLHEMRIAGTITATTGHVVPPMLLALQLVLRKKSGKSIPITRGYVPVPMICKSTNRDAELFGFIITLAPADVTVGAMAWKFSYPVDLAPGDFIEAQVKNVGLYNASVVVDLSFAGADAADLPSYRVPYVMHWQSRDFAYAETAVDSSPPDQLANGLGTDLHVDRIIGRFLSRNPKGTGDEVADFADLSDQSVFNANLRIGTAQKFPILRSYAPFRGVFGQDAAIETDFLLASGDYLTVDVQHTAGPTLTTPFTYFFGRGLISLVGWREVA
jgi:hypothetical protein